MVHYSITLSYDTQGARYFDKNGDVDNDGVWNPEEWNAALAAQEEPYVGVIYAATVNAFVQMAMDASIPETPESNGPYIYHGPAIYDENGNVYIAADDVIQLGSAKHLGVLAEATGANSAYIPTTTLTIGSTTGTDLKFDANVVDPPGFENVPLTKNQAFTCAKGRQIRVTMKGTEREKKWFKTWNAPGTLVNGTPSRSMVFRLGNNQQVITPVKRSVGSIGLDSRLSWSAKGYQPEEAHTGMEGSTNILYAPEDTYVTLSYNASSGSGAKSGAGETCKHVGWGVTGHDMSVDSQGLISTGSLQMDPSSGWAVMPSVSCCVNEPPDPADYSDNSEYLNDLSWYEACWDNFGNVSPAHSWTHTFKGDDGCTVTAAPIKRDSDYGEIAGLTPGGTMDTAPYPANNINFTDMVYYNVKLKPGYQLGVISYGGTTTAASVYGELMATFGTGPISAKISTEEMMTLDADVEVEGGNIPAAFAGTVTGGSLGNNTNLRGFYTRISDPDALIKPHPSTEFVEIHAAEFPGFVLKRWTGTCPVFDENGVLRTDVALDAGDDEPARWVTDQTIYVKCIDLKSVNGASPHVAASPKARAVLKAVPVASIDVLGHVSRSGNDITMLSAWKINFPGHQMHPFNPKARVSHDGVFHNGLHYPVFYNEAVNCSTFDFYDVEVHLTPLPSSCIRNDKSFNWTLLNAPGGNIAKAEDGAVLTGLTKGGIYKVQLDNGSGETPSEANIVLPLAGADITQIVSQDLSRASEWASDMGI